MDQWIQLRRKIRTQEVPLRAKSCSPEKCDYPTYLLRLCEKELLDRLTHKVHIIEANGVSYRLEQSRKRLARRTKRAEQN